MNTASSSATVLFDQPIPDVDESLRHYILYADAISKFVINWLGMPSMGPIIGIFGSFGSGKTSLLKLVEGKLPKCQTIWFRPTSYSDESEVAAAFLETALKQMQVEAKGFKRVKIKTRIWWHNVNLLAGSRDLLTQIISLLIRLLLYVGGPIFIINYLLTGGWSNIGSAIGAVLGGTAVFVEYIQKALEPGLSLDAGKFVKRVHENSVTSAVEEYVTEFQWISSLARGYGSPLVVMVDSIDDGLPLQTAIILESLRLFGVKNIPCFFIIAADQTSLKTAIQIRFLNQLGNSSDQGLQQNLIKMSTLYLDRIIRVPFILPPPPSQSESSIEREISSSAGAG